ncbi:cornifelin homolog B-like [Etheostoma cragini]|uniref:cornifelin homolog B-like n=1 Tax=Etheostoma cragini TaxID=417921 RepID=UPI00155EA9FF|nr:cornifelin homolog B-like [Etheostoma cragini]
MTSRMVVNQPQPVMVSRESEEWSSGICDCCDDVPECCFAFWCFPCFTCITSKKYGECLCLPLLDGFGLIPPITMSMRVSMRQRYRIRDTMCNDCLYSTFCTACAWCQMSREMKRRNIPIVLVSAKHA